MLPTLEHGDRLLVLRCSKARPGDLVTLPDPRDRRRTLVKRVASVSADGVVVVGDNPSQSTDSRAFGPCRRRRCGAVPSTATTPTTAGVSPTTSSPVGPQ